MIRLIRFLLCTICQERFTVSRPGFSLSMVTFFHTPGIIPSPIIRSSVECHTSSNGCSQLIFTSASTSVRKSSGTRQPVPWQKVQVPPDISQGHSLFSNPLILISSNTSDINILNILTFLYFQIQIIKSSDL